MIFYSTRDNKKTPYQPAEVIKMGLAPDGGLFVPDHIPSVSTRELISMSELKYEELAARILSLYLTDYTYDELLEDCSAAYSAKSFPDGACPLVCVGDNMYSLELWHGPTCAFKDMALQLMPRLLSRALVKCGEARKALVLVATSGDTGKAALEGYKNIDRLNIAVFFPSDGVSEIQKLQMQTQDGSNVHVAGLRGNFDDIQTAVKNIFADPVKTEELDRRGYFFSSANSINFGRLAPQIVYYFKAYLDLVKGGKVEVGESINICVPTGNFGNILAAYIAMLMGLPINKLICASNSNNILTDFLKSGRYDRNRGFHLTISPSMDILISSNLERLIYLVGGCEYTAKCMEELKNLGSYQVNEEILSKIQESFCGYYADEELTRATVKKYFEKFAYLLDTHTAVAFAALDKYLESTADNTPCVVASTASPYKFAADVYSSIFGTAPDEGTGALYSLSSRTNTEIPHPLKDLSSKKIRFDGITDTDHILDEIEALMK